MSGRKTSSETAVGRNWRASVSASAPRMRHQRLQPLVVRQIDEDARVVRIVLDDQQRRVVRLQIVAVVGIDFHRPLRRADGEAQRHHGRQPSARPRDSSARPTVVGPA